jgi:cell division septation protein DedD
VRNLFLALVLANLAFAAWHLWFSHPVRGTHLADPDVPGITLVSELPADLQTLPAVDESAASTGGTAAAAAAADTGAAGPPPAAGQTAATGQAAAASRALPSGEATATPPGGVAESSAAAGARCNSIGPFRELAQAATAAANLRTAGYQPTQRVAEGDIWIGYWVYLDAIASEAQANEILAKVRGAGVTDSYIIPNSDSGSLVSLGVFSEISGVSRRRDQVRALGFDPKVVDRTRRATVYWVDVVLTGDQTLDFDALQTPGRIVRLEQRKCEAPVG